MSTTGRDIVKNAMYELNILAAGEEPSDADAAFVLGKLNRIFDNWNAESLFIFGSLFFQGTLTPNKNPHTIGVAGSGSDFIVSTSRPPRIDEANLVLTDITPNVFRPLKIVDDAWWMRNPIPSIATQIPYYIYPNYGWPQGQLYLWPVPTVAYDIRLLLWTLFTSLALTDTFSLPAGYEDAVTLTLAESIAAPFGKQVDPLTAENAMKARARIKSMNSEAPEMKCDPAVNSTNNHPQLSIANFLSGFYN